MTMALRVPPRRWLDIAIPVLVIGVLFALIAPAVQRARENARRTQLLNELRQFGLALYNYHDVYSVFPPGGIIGPDGTAYRGWTTAVLPYLDASPLYNQIDQNVPWDSPRNEFEYQTVHPSFLSPGVEPIKSPEGYGLTHFETNPHLFYRNSAVALDEMTNGTAHTWAMGDVRGDFLPWGYPFNWRPLGDRLCGGPETYGRPGNTIATILFADGRVETVDDSVDPDVLRKWAAAPPVPTAEAMATPPVPKEFRWTGRTREWFHVGGHVHGTATFSKDRRDTEIKAHLMHKLGNEHPTAAQVQASIVDQYPEAVALEVGVTMDAEMAAVIAKLRRLRTLDVDNIEPTPDVIQSLQSMPELRSIQARSLFEAGAQPLREGLPGVTVNGVRNQAER